MKIDIKFAGICHSDIHQAKAEWGSNGIFPMVPGHEIGGVVSEVGPEVSKYKAGKLRGAVPDAQARARATGETGGGEGGGETEGGMFSIPKCVEKGVGGWGGRRWAQNVDKGVGGGWRFHGNMAPGRFQEKRCCESGTGAGQTAQSLVIRE